MEANRLQAAIGKKVRRVGRWYEEVPQVLGRLFGAFSSMWSSEVCL